MSIESAVLRVAELQRSLGWSPPPTQPPPGGFAGALGAAAASPGAVPAQAAAPGSYPHLSGDLDAAPDLLARLDALAARRGERFEITSGHRSYDEQARLWAGRGSNPFPVAQPGTSRHETGRAADVTIGGRPIQDVIPAGELLAAGIRPLAGDAVHVELVV
ncbi:MAG: M15 family metallopeptidase [Thermoleophilaceae bacterium]